MTLSEVSKLMAIIAVEFGEQFQVSRERAQLWHMVLQFTEYHDANDALINLLKEPSKWPPKVGEVCHEARLVRLARSKPVMRAIANIESSQKAPLSTETRKLLEDLSAKLEMKK